MISYEGKKIIEVWFGGYMIYPELLESVPDVIKKEYKSCFALGNWWNMYFLTNDLDWGNDINEVIENYNEKYGTDYDTEYTRP